MTEGTMGALTVSVKDFERDTGTVRVNVPVAEATLENAEALADFIATHSDAAVTGYGVNVDTTGEVAVSGEPYDKAHIRMVFLFEDANGGARRFSIPAPKKGGFQDNEQPTPELAGLVYEALNDIGLNLVAYNGGYLYSKGTRDRDTDITTPNP